MWSSGEVSRRVILAGFAVVVLAGCVVAVGIVVSVLSVSRDVERIQEHPLVVSNAANEVQHSVDSMQQYVELAWHAETPQQVEQQTQAWDEHYLYAVPRLQVIDRQFLGDPTQIDAVQADFDNYVELQRRLLREASTGTVTRDQIAASSDVEQDLESQLDEVIDFAFDRADRFADEVTGHLTTLTVVAAVASLVGIVATVGLAWAWSRSYGRQVRKLEKDAATISDNVLMLTLDERGRVTSISQALAVLLHVQPSAITGRLFLPDNTAEADSLVEEALAKALEGHTWNGRTTWTRHEDQEPLRLRARLVAAFDTGGTVTSMTAVFTDETSQVLSLTDQLTQLPNRRAFDTALDREVRRANRSGHYLTVAIADLDWFKNINDQCGHPAGDRTLQQVATELRQHFRREADSTFRIGGDEFAIIMAGPDPEKAHTILNTLIQHVADQPPDRACCPDRNNTLSIGAITTHITTGHSAETLYHEADQQLLKAKKHRNCLRTTDESTIIIPTNNQ